MFVRPYEPFDRQDVYDICVRTGDGGGDARGLYSDDELLPDVYAGSYLHLEPELAFVLDDGDRAVGYVLGTADTRAWAAACRRHWLPLVSPRYRLVEPPVTAEDHLVDTLHHPERNVLDELDEYPAHLHIDLLPGHQGAGHGRELMRTFLAALAERDVPGVHLGVAARNTGALRFYERLGFHRITGDEHGTTLGRRTDVPV
ncbi:GNAT family N-acetyltransferase [Cellulomonas sp. P22]|uniref:GNAT family N-acetyltransferase n=1 Tax=Cellulomonas sp. P22 TaxID=3373189 RepID=UPI0037ABD335